MLDRIIKSELGLDVVKEHKFHEIRRWRFDFAILDLKIAFEIEGGIWMKKSRHTSSKGFIGDMEKYNIATALGWRVIRIQTGDYTSALNYLKMMLNKLDNPANDKANNKD